MTPEQRQRAETILHFHEDKALAASTLNPGARETLEDLRRRGIRIGILTRNRKCNALAIARKHNIQFDRIVGREDGPVKPDAFGVRHLCRTFGVDPAETLLVGDYLHDLQCARAAGAVPVLLATHPRHVDTSHAFYLGYELAKAMTALTLAKQYEQDEALTWGYLTVAEEHHRFHRSGARPT